MGEQGRGRYGPEALIQTDGGELVSCTELEVKEGVKSLGRDSESNLGPDGPKWNCLAGSWLFRSATLGTGAGWRDPRKSWHIRMVFENTRE